MCTHSVTTYYFYLLTTVPGYCRKTVDIFKIYIIIIFFLKSPSVPGTGSVHVCAPHSYMYRSSFSFSSHNHTSTSTLSLSLPRFTPFLFFCGSHCSLVLYQPTPSHLGVARHLTTQQHCKTTTNNKKESVPV